MNLVLIGFRGSGKSTVGRQLAEQLGWPFVDTDELIEQQSGATVREIFADRAEEGFRQVESQIIAEVCRLQGQVISTGGGAILRDDNVAALKRSGKLVYLTAPPEVLWKRIFEDLRRQATRLQIDPATGLQQVREALTQRDPLYRKLADVVVETADRSISQIVQRIITRTGVKPLLRSCDAGSRHQPEAGS